MKRRMMLTQLSLRLAMNAVQTAQTDRHAARFTPTAGGAPTAPPPPGDNEVDGPEAAPAPEWVVALDTARRREGQDVSPPDQAGQAARQAVGAVNAFTASLAALPPSSTADLP